MPAYGFAVAMRRSDHRGAPALARIDRGDLSDTRSGGLQLVVRRYASTPEAVDEPQPIVTPSVILAYDGRVDNRAAIADALGLPHLASQSDGVVLAAAYDAWGPLLSARTIGEYAYVVFDRRTETLVAGQDSFGVRRVFYGAIGERLLIASNLRLLFEQFPDARPTYDPGVLPEYFVGPMSPWSGRTIWRGLRELGRGNVLVQRGRDLEERAAWRPDAGRRERFTSSDEVDEAFRAQLFAAVRAALRSPGPVLCDLSGGFDSSTVCAVASRVTAADRLPPIVGWSMISRRTDERRAQNAMRAQYPLEWHTIDIDRHLPFQAFTDTEIPTGGFMGLGSINRALRRLAAERGIRARLSGQAADILFNKGGGGPPVYLAEWWRERRYRDWARHLLAHVKGGSFSAWHLLRECTIGTLDLHAGSREPIPDWIAPAFRRELARTNEHYLRHWPRTFRSTARERVYRWTLSFIPCNVALPDERLPFVYRPLVELVLALDWAHLVRPNEERVLMRRSLRGILPEAVQNGRGQVAFSAALLEGLRAAWPRLSRVVSGDRLAELGVVEPKRFKAALATMVAGYWGPNTRMAMTALYLETWLALKGRPIDAP